MNDMKTTKDKAGNEYQIGALYRFYDEAGEAKYTGTLCAIDNSSEYPFIDSTQTGFRYCEEVKEQIGTITPAPVKLVEGEVYRLVNTQCPSDFFYGEYCGDNDFETGKYGMVSIGNDWTVAKRMVPAEEE